MAAREINSGEMIFEIFPGKVKAQPDQWPGGNLFDWSGLVFDKFAYSDHIVFFVFQ